MKNKIEAEYKMRDPNDFRYSDLSTPTGQYLRSFWQPVYHICDLESGHATPLRIMNQTFTLYRGESGDFHLTEARCPHRRTLLSTGRVEGECISCFYHGWKFDSDGQCVEQPAEDSEFAHKVKIQTYPTRQYLGLVFAFLGEGVPPDFPIYPEFDQFDGLIEVDSYRRDCNFFHNLENALDMSHVEFVHGNNEAAFSGFGHGSRLSAIESDWGVEYSFKREDGQLRINHFGMPNIFYMNALPTDPDIGWQESLFWWVPIDDGRHVQFSIHRVPIHGEARRRVSDKRQARRHEIDQSHLELCKEILEGRLRLQDVDPLRADIVRLQDDVAQLGQGIMADRTGERLGRGDVGVIAIRKLWQRELFAFETGHSLKNWRRDANITPKTWGLAGDPPQTGVVEEGCEPDIVDVRPYIEIKEQMELHHN